MYFLSCRESGHFKWYPVCLQIPTELVDSVDTFESTSAAILTFKRIVHFTVFLLNKEPKLESIFHVQNSKLNIVVHVTCAVRRDLFKLQQQQHTRASAMLIRSSLVSISRSLKCVDLFCFCQRS